MDGGGGEETEEEEEEEEESHPNPIAACERTAQKPVERTRDDLPTAVAG